MYPLAFQLVRSERAYNRIVLERVENFEISTSSLAMKYSSSELYPHISGRQSWNRTKFSSSSGMRWNDHTSSLSFVWYRWSDSNRQTRTSKDRCYTNSHTPALCYWRRAGVIETLAFRLHLCSKQGQHPRLNHPPYYWRRTESTIPMPYLRHLSFSKRCCHLDS
jgi:hypothetical protein